MNDSKLEAALHGATDEQREALIAAAARANERARQRARADMDRIVDAPELNEMEKHMRVRDYVSEMLSYMPHPFLQRADGRSVFFGRGVQIPRRRSP